VPAHNQVVQREFAAQAAGFEDPRYVFADERILDWILSHVPVEPHFIVLDVAAGAGHLARAIAPRAHHVIAFDLTPEMLATGKAAADAAGISNLVFERGDAASLPYLDDSFDLVVSRFAVHHFAEPERQISEMVRVCRPGGRVAIIDLVTADPVLGERHNELERLRDPSHTTAVAPDRMVGLIESSGAVLEHEVSTDQELDVGRWFAQAGTEPEAASEIRAALEAELEGGTPTGMRPVRGDGKLRFTQRWAIFVAGVRSPA
jgi:ubiquinone/menaquinone biosynthesis C-methylase UbiE